MPKLAEKILNAFLTVMLVMIMILVILFLSILIREALVYLIGVVR